MFKTKSRDLYKVFFLYLLILLVGFTYLSSGKALAAGATGEVIPGTECGALDTTDGTVCQFFPGLDSANHDVIILVGGGAPGGHSLWDPNTSWTGYKPIEHIRGASVINIATRASNYPDGSKPTIRKNIDDMKRAIAESLEWFENNKDSNFSGKWYWIGSSYGAVLGSIYLPVLSSDATADMPTAFGLDSPYGAFHWGMYVASPEDALPEVYQSLLLDSLDCDLGKAGCENKVKEVGAAYQFDGGDLDIPTLFAEGDLDDRNGVPAANHLHLTREGLGKTGYVFLRFADRNHVPMVQTLDSWNDLVDFLYDSSCAFSAGAVAGGGMCPATATSSDNTAPTVSVTDPLDGSTVKRGSAVLIRADASDNMEVAKVEFYVNSSLICSDDTLEYTCEWIVPKGKPGIIYELQAKAYDSSGNIGLSDTITVTSN